MRNPTLAPQLGKTHRHREIGDFFSCLNWRAIPGLLSKLQEALLPLGHSMGSKRYLSRLERRVEYFVSPREEALPRVSLECNPEIPVAPGEEHYVLDKSLDEVYFALQ